MPRWSSTAIEACAPALRRGPRKDASVVFEPSPFHCVLRGALPFRQDNRFCKKGRSGESLPHETEVAVHPFMPGLLGRCSCHARSVIR
jgi:hypothetical protein